MSLVAWYPLNGNTNDYSGNGHNLANSGASIDANGKIGLCYLFDGSASRLTFAEAPLGNSVTNFSISLWTKGTIKASEYTYIIHRGSDNTIGNAYYAIGTLNTGELFFDINGKYSIGNSGVVPDANSWYHVVMIYENGIVTGYINGVKKVTYSTSITKTVTGTLPCIGDSNIAYATRKYNGRLNDVRIYNHALSTKEIKEIYKACIVHYTFDECGESTTNLLHGRLFATTDTKNNHNGWLKTGVGNDNPRTTLMSTNITVSASTFYTLSCLYWSSNGIVDDVYLHFTDAGWTESVNYIQPFTSQSMARGGSFTITDLGGGWNYCVGTFQTLSTTTTLDQLFFDVDIPNVQAFISDIQLEQKDHATEYVAGSRTGVVVDHTGYGNNYTVPSSTSPSWTMDSKIGRGAFKFDGSNDFLVVPNMACKIAPPITLSAWAYRDNWQSSTGERIMSCTEGGGWQLGFNDTAGYISMPMYISGVGYMSPNARYALSNIPVGASWHHIAGTFDGTYAKFYFDGELVDTKTASGSTIGYNATNSIIIGGEPSTGAVAVGNYWNGKIDDVRIYAAALSADDIKALYQVRASLDNKGNLFCSGKCEYFGGNYKISSRGLLNALNIVENATISSGAVMEVKRDTTVYLAGKLYEL